MATRTLSEIEKSIQLIEYIAPAEDHPIHYPILHLIGYLDELLQILPSIKNGKELAKKLRPEYEALQAAANNRDFPTKKLTFDSTRAIVLDEIKKLRTN